MPLIIIARATGSHRPGHGTVRTRKRPPSPACESGYSGFL
jgi:hypothetical protein